MISRSSASRRVIGRVGLAELDAAVNATFVGDDQQRLIVFFDLGTGGSGSTPTGNRPGRLPRLARSGPTLPPAPAIEWHFKQPLSARRKTASPRAASPVAATSATSCCISAARKLSGAGFQLPAAVRAATSSGCSTAASRTARMGQFGCVGGNRLALDGGGQRSGPPLRSMQRRRERSGVQRRCRAALVRRAKAARPPAPAAAGSIAASAGGCRHGAPPDSRARPA